MRPFKFRAEVALEARRRQDEAAQRALATAKSASRLADEQLTTAGTALTDADLRARQSFQDLRRIDELIWQGNWIAGLERNVARARQVLEERRIDERRAAEIAQHARMQVRVLERLKERAFGAWQIEARRAEQKALDELGSLQFAARRLAAME